MIKIRKVDDANPALAHSPMVRALEKIFCYVAEHGGIGLTPSKAFKRAFVHWAAREFDWPGYTAADLFGVNKVLNEIDFGPLMDLHDVMIALKIGRHYKSQFKLSKAGHTLVGHPGRLFGIVTPFYLFEVNHARFSRYDDKPVVGNWDIFLTVLNTEAEAGVIATDLRRTLYGEPNPGGRFDDVLGRLYVQVLRPLCWTGLLHEERVHRPLRIERSMFTKTPLWRAVLRLEKGHLVPPATRH